MLKPKKKMRGSKVPHHKNTANLETIPLPTPSEVEISMSQHIGAPCDPCVNPGDYVFVGQVIGDSKKLISAPIHSSVSGTVKSISSNRAMQGGKNKTIIISADGKQTICPDIKPPIVTNHREFIEAVKSSGLVGLGGAAFPSHVKFNPPNIEAIDCLIINGAECEPFITSDHRLMVENTQRILDGVKALVKYLEIPQAFIGIENNKPDAIAKLEELIKQEGIDNISIVSLAELYPKGAERVIVEEITGKQLPAGVIPADLGVVVTNIGTAAFIGDYLADGIPLIKKRITVDGSAITTPKNLIVPIGTRISDIVEFCDGFKEQPFKLIMGGLMMGITLLSDDMPIIKNTNAVLAFNKKDSYIAPQSSCIHCGRCNQACPFHLVPAAISLAYVRRDTKEMEALNIMQCMECGSCSLVCPARRPLNFTHRIGKILVKEAKENAKF